MRPVICMVSERRRFGDRADDALVAAVAAAALGGVDLVQIRERDLEARDLVRLAARCVDAALGTRTRILVNDRVDVALAAGAHGVHLRADSMPARRVRAITPPGFVIGRSVHQLAEAVRASDDGGLDYLIFGTVFATASKGDVAPVGVRALRTVVAATALPVLAIGGITEHTVRAVGQTGAAGFAAIGLFAEAPLADLAGTIDRVARLFTGDDD